MGKPKDDIIAGVEDHITREREMFRRLGMNPNAVFGNEILKALVRLLDRIEKLEAKR